jgi:Ca2+-binding RTX toxin-like protein
MRAGAREERMRFQLMAIATLAAAVASLAGPAAVAAKDIRGTAGPDVLSGWCCGDDDTIEGLGGDDVIRGLGGDDRLFGGAGRDWVRGDPDRDLVAGGPGDDRVGGGGSDDVLRGGPGDDILHPGLGDDVVRAGPGDDVVNVDGDAPRPWRPRRIHVDRVHCGGGWDIVVLDAPDVAGPSCEVLIRVG